MSGTWPGFASDWEESSEYQERRARVRQSFGERAAREQRNRENMAIALERQSAREGSRDVPVSESEGEGSMECKHCGREIVNVDGAWVDPEATGDDSMWRETCDSHDTFIADHEPVAAAIPQWSWRK